MRVRGMHLVLDIRMPPARLMGKSVQEERTEKEATTRRVVEHVPVGYPHLGYAVVGGLMSPQFQVPPPVTDCSLPIRQSPEADAFVGYPSPIKLLSPSLHAPLWTVWVESELAGPSPGVWQRPTSHWVQGFWGGASPTGASPVSLPRVGCSQLWGGCLWLSPPMRGPRRCHFLSLEVNSPEHEGMSSVFWQKRCHSEALVPEIGH